MPSIEGRSRYRDDEGNEHHVTMGIEVTETDAGYHVGNDQGVVPPHGHVRTENPGGRRMLNGILTDVKRQAYRKSPPNVVPKPVSTDQKRSTAATHRVCTHCGGTGMLEGKDGCWSECLVCQRAEEEMGYDDV